jgi:hypothetical protein
VLVLVSELDGDDAVLIAGGASSAPATDGTEAP